MITCWYYTILYELNWFSNVRKDLFMWWDVKHNTLASIIITWTLYSGADCPYALMSVESNHTFIFQATNVEKQQQWLMCSREESEKLPCVIEQKMLWCLPLQRQISFLSLNVITERQWAEEKPLPLSLTHTRCLLLFQLQMSSRKHSRRG